MKRKISQDEELNLEDIVEFPSKKKRSGHLEVLNRKKAHSIKQSTLDDTVSLNHTQPCVAFDTLTQLEDDRETPSKKKKKTKKVTSDEVCSKQTQSSVSFELKINSNNNNEKIPSSKNNKTKKITPYEVNSQQTQLLLSLDAKIQMENCGDTAFKKKKKAKRVTQESPDEASPTQAEPCVTLETKTQQENVDETPKKKKSKKKSEVETGGVENLQKKTKKKKNPKETEGEAGQQSEAEDKEIKVVQYLRLWHLDRPSWKFNKHLQVRLFHLMYNPSVIPDKDFSSLLLYLEGLQGKGREKTKQDAKKILEEEEVKEAADPDRESRARQIYQLLD